VGWLHDWAGLGWAASRSAWKQKEKEKNKQTWLLERDRAQKRENWAEK
jgi:hypothetical protein